MLTLGLLLALATSARAASIWTPLSSGTTDDITAVDYQSEASFFFATTNGKIFQKTGASFTQRHDAGPAVNFSDIAMRGLNGLAVANNARVFRTINGGVTWLDVSAGLPTVASTSDCASALPGANLFSVRWASDTTAWIFGEGRTIDTYTLPAGTYAAKNAGAPCKVTETISDAFFVDPTDVYFISRDGGIFFTSDALGSTAASKGHPGPNGFGAVDRLAGDPANTNRQWAVNDYPSVGGPSFLTRTETGWATGSQWSQALNFGSQDYTRPLDVAYGGGTVLEAGDAGQIITSIDGASFFVQPADGALATKNWRTVSLADASHAAVGGVGGALVVSDRANTVPDIVVPTGTISGAATVRAGKPATFTAVVADNAGGSGIDPNGFGWTTPGQTNRTGGSTTFTFADPGLGGTSQTITLGFRDLAGNTATATKTVSILQAVKPKRKHPGLTLKAKPKRDRRAPFKFSFSGAVKPPRGTSCAGKVKVSVAAGRRALKRKTVNLTSKKCTYKVSVSFKSRTSIRKAKKLKVSAVYGGSSKLTSARKSTTVKTK